jgi:hypothetical protein
MHMLIASSRPSSGAHALFKHFGFTVERSADAARTVFS